MASIAATAGLDGVPPGILCFGSSHGCLASGCASIHASASAIRRSASGATASTIPSSSARDGGMRRPSVSSGSACCSPSRRTSFTVPPAPGMSPSVTSGKPSSIDGSSRHTRAWQARASSSPPPSALPLIAATTGRPSRSRRRRQAFSACTSSKKAFASSGPTARSECRSPPAKNVRFADVRTTPRRLSRSASRRSTIAARSSRNAAFIVFTA